MRARPDGSALCAGSKPGAPEPGGDKDVARRDDHLIRDRLSVDCRLIDGLRFMFAVHPVAPVLKRL
jgi:hypothetical protein